MNKFIAVVIWRGLENETLLINAKNQDEAFEKLFNYYLNKSDRLGHWLDGDGEPVADFDEVNGIFEFDADWSCHIVNETKIKILD